FEKPGKKQKGRSSDSIAQPQLAEQSTFLSLSLSLYTTTPSNTQPSPMNQALKVLRRQPKLKRSKSQKFEKPLCLDPPQAQLRTFNPAIRVALRLGKFMVPKSILREAAHQNRLRNAQAPIHRLPPELLAEIMVYTIDWMYWGTWQLRILATVSTYWRDIILSSPRCWSVLDGLHEPQEWKAVLAHNPAGFIDLRCAAFSHERVDEFVPLAVAEAPRTGTLTLWVDDENDLMERVFGVPFPALRDLLVHNSATDQKLIPSLGEGVNLRHVELYRTGMRWDEPRLTNLTTLCLAALIGGVPTASQLHTLLSCSPNLERLRVTDWGDFADASYLHFIDDLESSSSSTADSESGRRNAIYYKIEESFSALLESSRLAKSEPSPPPAPQQPKFPPIQLNQLSALIATYLPPEVVAFLFSVIRAPSCQTVLVTHGVGDKTANAILDFAIPIIEAAPCMVLTLDPNSSYIRISSEPMPGIPATWVLWSKDIPGFDAQLMNVDVKAVSMRIAAAANLSSQFVVMPLVPAEEHVFEDLLSDLEVVR
ncbi:hypothetical protein FRC01_013301, partial [Tulasnella sp. 417]